MINGNGKVKEYDDEDNDLIFEEEYLNGKRNGKGKEYELGYLEYEGEFNKGMRHGKGKEYDFDEEVEYYKGKRKYKKDCILI